MNQKIANELLKVAESLTASEGYIFLIYDKWNDEYYSKISVHSSPKAGGQVLKDGMSKGQAIRFVEKYAEELDHEILKFIETGHGHKVKYKEVKRF